MSPAAGHGDPHYPGGPGELGGIIDGTFIIRGVQLGAGCRDSLGRGASGNKAADAAFEIGLT